MIRYISTLLLALSLSLPAYALNLNQAMSALGDAKASGQLCLLYTSDAADE